MSLRLLANENVPREVVEALRLHGHSVMCVADTLGLIDARVLDRAVNEDRILLTFDKDFGELAFRSRLPASCGVLLVRARPVSPAYLARVVVEALSQPRVWQGHFSVIEDGYVRTSPLPTSGGL